MSGITSIIKYLVLYRLFTIPEVETAIICIALLLLLFFGAFVKLKNGILSWISYILLISIPAILLTINLINISLPTEDLKLSDIKVEKYSEVNETGIVFKRFLRRTVNEPLLGIQPTTDKQRVDDFVVFINNAYPDGNVAYRTSKKYEGIMLVDAAGKDLNLALIRDGYFNVSVKTPSQYLVAANEARSKGVGIWATKVGMRPQQIEELTFYILCFMFGVLIAQEYVRRAYKMVDLKESFNDEEKESDSGSSVETSDSTTSRGSTPGS